MQRIWLVVPALLCAHAAMAQNTGLSVSAGVRAWYAEWTSFNYYAPPPANTNQALTQISGNNKLVLMPTFSARYGDFSGAISLMPSTTFSFDDGTSSPRSEFEANLGYTVVPGVALTLGYKKISQGGGADRYRPSGPVLGVSANAPLNGALSLYGSLGLGRLRTPSGDNIQYRADYRLGEVGLAYTLNAGWPRWTVTGGYRVQVLTSKDAFNGQDGQDTTQGFTFGALATF